MVQIPTAVCRCVKARRVVEGFCFFGDRLVAPAIFMLARKGCVIGHEDVGS